MRPVATLALCVAIGALFGWSVPLERLAAASQSISASLAIIAAALLVRLNRTMPSLDWKAIDRERRETLTSQIVFLTREYLVVLAVVAVLAVSMIALTVTGEEAIFGRRDAWTGVLITVGWPDAVRRIISGVLGFGIALVLVRMSYVVWRDYDIARLQKAIVDAAAAKEHQDEQASLAEAKLSAIRKAKLRSVRGGPPLNWDQ